MRYRELATALADLGAHAVMRTLSAYSSLVAEAREQAEEFVVPAPKVTAEDGNVRWSEWSPAAIFSRWRALPPTFQLFTRFRSPHIRSPSDQSLLRVNLRHFLPPTREGCDLPTLSTWNDPGTVIADTRKNVLWIRCGTENNKGWIACSELHVEGRRVSDAVAFANGYMKNKSGSEVKFIYQPTQMPTTDLSESTKRCNSQ
jgi:methionyl-tRNA formyltransferase